MLTHQGAEFKHVEFDMITSGCTARGNQDESERRSWPIRREIECLARRVLRASSSCAFFVLHVK